MPLGQKRDFDMKKTKFQKLVERMANEVKPSEITVPISVGSIRYRIRPDHLTTIFSSGMVRMYGGPRKELTESQRERIRYCLMLIPEYLFGSFEKAEMDFSYDAKAGSEIANFTIIGLALNNWRLANTDYTKEQEITAYCSFVWSLSGIKLPDELQEHWNAAIKWLEESVATGQSATMTVYRKW
jgi:hypothetical protein